MANTAVRGSGASEHASTSWPGSLMERAFALVAADFNRPAGPVIMAVLLAAAAVLGYGKTGPLGQTAAPVLGVLATAPIAVIRRVPGPAISVILAASAAFVMFGRLSWSPAAVVGWLVALGACPLLLARRRAVIALVLTEAAVLLGPARFNRNFVPWDAIAAEALAVIAAWGAGEVLRARRQAAAERSAVAERVRYLSERAAVARERSGIARELHDVVAHHVSMIAVRAATAPYAVSGLPEDGKAAFAEIADEARTALTELRVVLGVLRSPDGSDAAQAAPQPRIADLDALLCRVTSAGTNATLSTTGEVRQLPGSVELCCYRVVQEALTNAGRHAPGSQVSARVCYGEDELTVTVANGPGDRPARRPSAAGFGLTGLRERVTMLRGDFSAGPDRDGGFVVSAVLPAPLPPEQAAP